MVVVVGVVGVVVVVVVVVVVEVIGTVTGAAVVVLGVFVTGWSQSSIKEIRQPLSGSIKGTKRQPIGGLPGHIGFIGIGVVVVVLGGNV